MSQNLILSDDFYTCVPLFFLQCNREEEFLTPKGGTPNESYTPNAAYATPVGPPVTPTKFKDFLAKRPRKLYQAVIPELEETLQQVFITAVLKLGTIF